MLGNQCVVITVEPGRYLQLNLRVRYLKVSLYHLGKMSWVERISEGKQKLKKEYISTMIKNLFNTGKGRRILFSNS